MGDYRDLRDLIKIASDMRASDLFIKEGSPPGLRVNGRIQVMEGYDKLTADDTRRLAYSIMTHEQIGRFEHRNQRRFRGADAQSGELYLQDEDYLQRV